MRGLPEKKRPRGRPTDYKDQYCDDLIEHMANGLSYESFAGVVGVSRQTLYDWEKKHPSFLDTKKIATEMSMLFWEKLGLNSLIEEKQMNSAIYIFTMKNRFKWTDRVEVTGDAEKPIPLAYNPKKITDEEV